MWNARQWTSHLSAASRLRARRDRRDADAIAGGGRRVGGASCAATLALPLEPQSRHRKRGQWFEGWFVRLIDHTSGVTIAAIFGSLRLQRSSSGAAAISSLPFDEHILVLAWSADSGRQSMRSVQLAGDAVTLSGPGTADPTRPHVRWWSTEHGGIEVRGDDAWLDLRLPKGLSLAANVSSPRAPWDRKRPDRAGPEGWLGATGLLPCHYFVHTFRSPATYWLGGSSRSTGRGGRGVAHIERNYGEAFPSGWVWAQACTEGGTLCLVLTGGLFVVGPLTTRTYILALRGQPANSTATLDWTFRTTDADRVSEVREACQGRLLLNATSLDGRRRAALRITAPVGTFGDRLLVPTDGGFSDQPGCRESYDATVALVAHGRAPGLDVEATFPRAALEFGGTWQCGSC